MSEPPEVQIFIDKLNELLSEEKAVPGETITPPYKRMADRKLLDFYVASCEAADMRGEILGVEACLQADELKVRGYDVSDLSALKRRLEK
jgi:hypothetical protein